MLTGIGVRDASASNPARSPPRVRPAGRMPCASSRSSTFARSALSSASRISAGSAGSPRSSAPHASLRVMIVWTRRCCAPSCRSRTTRRRSSSVAATIRARDAASSARLALFEIAVATSSVNSASRCLDVVGQRPALGDAGAHHAPEFAGDDDRGARALADPGRADRRHDRAGHRAEVLDPDRPADRGERRGGGSASTGQLVPFWNGCGRSLQAPTTLGRAGRPGRARSPRAPCPAPAPPPARWRRTPPATPPRRPPASRRDGAPPAAPRGSRPPRAARVRRAAGPRSRRTSPRRPGRPAARAAPRRRSRPSPAAAARPARPRSRRRAPRSPRDWRTGSGLRDPRPRAAARPPPARRRGRPRPSPPGNRDGAGSEASGHPLSVDDPHARSPRDAHLQPAKHTATRRHRAVLRCQTRKRLRTSLERLPAASTAVMVTR